MTRKVFSFSHNRYSYKSYLRNISNVSAVLKGIMYITSLKIIYYSLSQVIGSSPVVLNTAVLWFIFVKYSQNSSEFGLYSGKLCELLKM